jgi:hypothetical protein
MRTCYSFTNLDETFDPTKIIELDIGEITKAEILTIFTNLRSLILSGDN